jgi:hypothetical protein
MEPALTDLVQQGSMLHRDVTLIGLRMFVGPHKPVAIERMEMSRELDSRSELSD